MKKPDSAHIDAGAGSAASLKFPKKTGTRHDAMDPENERLFMALKALRRGLAEAAAVPPYVIFSDKTIEDIVAKRPRTVEELHDVYGIGAVKAERYGEFIVQTIRDEKE
jgi:ATP-dependent DNA helicase RecQ